MNKTYAILGYSTENIGDDIQSFIAGKIFSPKYIINRDDYTQVYSYETRNPVSIEEDRIHLIMNGWMMHDVYGHGPYSPQFTNNYKFPIENKRIVPIFLATHLSPYVPYLLEKQCIDYYKQHEPIYCRDG